jgi:hypothetical protein
VKAFKNATRAELAKESDERLFTEDETSNVLSPLGLCKVSRSRPNLSSSSSKLYVVAYKTGYFFYRPNSVVCPSFRPSLRFPLQSGPPTFLSLRCDASPLGFHPKSHPRHFWRIRRSLLHSLRIISALLFTTLRYPRSLVCSHIRLLAYNTRSPPSTM